MRESPAVLLRSYGKTSNLRRCLFGSLRKSLGHPHRIYMFGFPTCKYVNATEKVSSRNSLRPIGSILQKLLHRRHDVARLG